MNIGNNPAYPHPGEACDADYYQNYGYSGMTIRQRYAMAAMQGFVINGWLIPSIIVKQAFDVADAMLQYEELEREANRQEGKQTYTEESEAETKKDIR